MPALMPDGRCLIGELVRLDPLRLADVPDLFTALDDERVWAAGYGGGPSGRPATAAQLAEQLTARRALPGHTAYVVRLRTDSGVGAAGTVVGTSTLGDPDLANERVHLGWTAYSPTVWASKVNPECKFLLLSHAFEDCGFGRVKIQTDSINTRSQAAIAKLGAVREGVLRRHVVRPDGSHRDTVVYSVIAPDWPAVRTSLVARLAVRA